MSTTYHWVRTSDHKTTHIATFSKVTQAGLRTDELVVLETKTGSITANYHLYDQQGEGLHHRGTRQFSTVAEAKKWLRGQYRKFITGGN